MPDKPAARIQRRGPARGTSSPAPAQHTMLGGTHGAQGFEMIQGFPGQAMMSDHESMMHAASGGSLPGPFQQQQRPLGVSAPPLEEQQHGSGAGPRKPMQPMASPFGTSQVQQVGWWQAAIEHHMKCVHITSSVTLWVAMKCLFVSVSQINCARFTMRKIALSCCGT